MEGACVAVERMKETNFAQIVYFCDWIELILRFLFLFRLCSATCKYTWRIRAPQSCTTFVVCGDNLFFFLILFFKCLGIVGYEFTTCLTMASAIIRMLSQMLRLCAHKRFPSSLILSTVCVLKYSLWISFSLRKHLQTHKQKFIFLLYFFIEFEKCLLLRFAAPRKSRNNQKILLDMNESEAKFGFEWKSVRNHAWNCDGDGTHSVTTRIQPTTKKRSSIAPNCSCWWFFSLFQLPKFDVTKYFVI